jgi:hypothetical protein
VLPSQLGAHPPPYHFCSRGAGRAGMARPGEGRGMAADGELDGVRMAGDWDDPHFQIGIHFQCDYTGAGSVTFLRRRRGFAGGGSGRKTSAKLVSATGARSGNVTTNFRLPPIACT